MDQSALQVLIDRAAISDTILSYATGVDRRDWALYRSIFTDSIDIDFSSWSGLKTRMPADEWVATVRATLGCFDATQHNITNHVIAVNGDQAVITAYMVARHSFEKEMQILGGFYTHRLLRAPPGWQLSACKLVITWEQSDRALFDRASKRDARLQDKAATAT